MSRHTSERRARTRKRRIGAEESDTRKALLDAALQLMMEEGYAAVTSRRVAARAGLKPQLVHYYFRTMDDLFVALVRRGAEQNLSRLSRVLASPEPLRALWRLGCDPAGATLTTEFSALANHRKAIRAELGARAEEFRRLQTRALSTVLMEYGIDPVAFPPDAVLVLVTAVSQILVMEEALGLTTGHAETRALVERYLARYEAGAPGEGEGSGDAGSLPRHGG
ncbi:MAG TPA: TetR/AcrR family transcriptional regulator [Myxococcota bacterium]|nr:TetR/AcrR family transcriptional regulator [Myxococcota bacterium]